MKRSVLLPIGLAAAIVLAGCSTATGAGATPPTSIGAPTRGSATGGGGTGGRFGGFPGVSGLVADVSGSTAQVQTPTSQTAVRWTKATRFSEERPSTAAALKVGDCVVAVSRSTAPGGSAPTTPAPTTSPSASGQATQVAATTVEIFSATSTGCGFGPRTGGGGAGRSGSGGATTTPPSGIPTPRASITGGPRNGARFGASGTVTAIESASFTIASTRGPAKGTPQTVTVTWSGTTRFTTSASTNASAVKVGVCLSAAGKAGDTGAVTATTVTLSSPVNGSCVQSGRFQRGGPGPRPTATVASLNG